MKTALIVDDELITRLDFSQMLKEMNFDIISTAADGFDAVEHCRQNRPDIVLMDLNMPIFDGFSAIERIIREGLAGSVIVITGNYDQAAILRAIDLGVGGYLVKPVDDHQLFPVVQIAMASHEREKKLRDQINQSEARIDELKLIDRVKSQLAADSGISEAEAYRKIQKLAMDKRCSISAIARSILESNSSHELRARAKQYLMDVWNISEKEAFQKLNLLAQEKQCSMDEAARQILLNKDKS